MSQPKITVYLTGWCPYCQRAKQLLGEKGLTYNEIDVEADAKFRQEMMERSQRRSVPQIFIGETHVGGCDDLFALESSGELDRLIQGAG
jgi:glutaredoxin 3